MNKFLLTFVNGSTCDLTQEQLVNMINDCMDNVHGHDYVASVHGYVDIPEELFCDDCETKVDTDFGDSRHKVTKVLENGEKEERMICGSCAVDLFGDDIENDECWDGN